MTHGIYAAEMSWPGIEAALANDAIAILPIAASCKEHGKHLPMATDYIQAKWLTSQLIKELNTVVWPSVSYGYYPAFLDYPGSCSLNEKTFEAVVTEIVENIFQSGAKKTHLLNTGISTIPPLENVVNKLSATLKIHLINIYRGSHFLAAEKKLKQQTVGSHADEIETSIMLAIASEKVNMKLAETSEFNKRPGPLNRTHFDKANFSPSGVYGNARLATKEKGKILIEAMLKDVLQAIKTFQHQ